MICGKEASDLYLSYYDSDGNMQDLPMAGGTVAKTELEAVCDALCAISTERAAPLWMPPLKPNLQQEELPAKETALTLGLLDDLAHQQQIPFSMSVWDGRNLAVCGMVGSGKSMFVETLIQSCLVKSENILYLFDFDKPLFINMRSTSRLPLYFKERMQREFKAFSAL